MLAFLKISFWKQEMSGSFASHPVAAASDWWEKYQSLVALPQGLEIIFSPETATGFRLSLELHL